MTPAETAAILRQFNGWRRDFEDKVEQPDSGEISEAIDAAIEMIDRLEAAESDALEQARLNGMGASREASLMAKLEAAEKSDAESIAMYRKARDERDELRAELTDLRNSMAFRTSLIGRIEAEREELHALIAAVKKQVNAEFRLRMKKEIECNALRAEVEAMKRQEPAAWLDDGTCRAGSEATAHRVVTNETRRDMPASVAASFSVPLYALPGAQGE